MTSYGGIIRIRSRVEAGCFLSACQTSSPVFLNYTLKSKKCTVQCARMTTYDIPHMYQASADAMSSQTVLSI
jgi:hypothetical protein